MSRFASTRRGHVSRFASYQELDAKRDTPTIVQDGKRDMASAGVLGTTGLIEDTCPGPLVSHADGYLECRWEDCTGPRRRHVIEISCGLTADLANGPYVAECGDLVAAWPSHECSAWTHISRNGLPSQANRSRH